ncbi:glycosyltransferase family 4 protein [Salegentibacter sp. HM20]
MQEELIRKYNIEKKIIIEDYKIPSSRFKRFLKALYLLFINIRNCYTLLLFIQSKEKKFQLKWIFQFNFYKQFQNIDIIHVQYGTNVKPVDVLKKINLLRSKLIVSFHGHDAFFPINGIIPNNNYYADLFNSENYIVANTPYLYKQILSLGCEKKKLKIFPIGVDTEFFVPTNKGKSNSGQFQIVNVGRLDKVKGHIYLIELMKILIQKGYKVFLTIVGEGEERPALESKIKEYKLTDYISLVGSRNQKEVKLFLQNSDLYIFPAIPVENGRRETQGLATLEAQACGLPVIAYNSGGIKYTFLDKVTGFLVAEFDFDNLLIKTEELINNPVLRKKMGLEARVFVQSEYSQSKLKREWCELYESL